MSKLFLNRIKEIPLNFVGTLKFTNDGKYLIAAAWDPNMRDI